MSKRDITASSFVNNLTSPQLDSEGIRQVERSLAKQDSLEEEPDVPSELNSRFGHVTNNLVELSCCSGRSHLDQSPEKRMTIEL